MELNAYAQFGAFILDMDGTLVDSGQLHEKAWITALERYGIPIDRSMMRSLAGVPTLETVSRLIEHFDLAVSATPEEVRQVKEEEVSKHLLDYVKPTALAELVRYNFGKTPMAVGTGATTASAKAILDACDLSRYIDCVVGADQVTAHKPAPDTFLRCAEKLGVHPTHCMVFEDAELGIQAAKSAGMHCVNVDTELKIRNDYFLPLT